VSVACAELRERLPRYLEDALPIDERRELREHFASCDRCAGEIAQIEPSILFARVPPEEVSAADVLSVLAGVRAGITLAETERRVGRSRGRSRRRLAAIASAAALAAMTLVLPGGGPADRRPVESVARTAPVAAPATGFAPAAAKAPAAKFPSDATIYDWNPGTASQEPRVVWIVDRSLDI
jgi:anti-sigma factor RsiW